MTTKSGRDFDDLSIEELIELLLAKTTALLDAHANKLDGHEVQQLMVQVEQLSSAIKAKKQDLN